MSKSGYTMQHNWNIIKSEFVARQQTLDVMTITLCQLGFGKEELIKFQQLFQENERDYCRYIKADKDDKQLTWSSKKLDDALQELLPAELFVPHNERYDYESLANEFGFTLKKKK